MSVEVAEDDKSDVIKNSLPKIDSYMVPVVFDKAAHSHKQQAREEDEEGRGRGAGEGERGEPEV